MCACSVRCQCRRSVISTGRPNAQLATSISSSIQWQNTTCRSTYCASSKSPTHGSVSFIGRHNVLSNSYHYYPHMPIGKVWIYRLLFVCVFVCTVTDFSAEDEASGVKFCTAVHRRPRRGISHFGELSSPRRQKNRTNRLRRIASVAHAMASQRMRAGQPWRGQRGRAHGPRIGSACVDIRPSSKTDVLVRSVYVICDTYCVRVCLPMKYLKTNTTWREQRLTKWRTVCRLPWWLMTTDVL